MKIKKGFVLREVCGEHVIVGEGLGAVNFGKREFRQAAGPERDGSMVVETGCGAGRLHGRVANGEALRGI